MPGSLRMPNSRRVPGARRVVAAFAAVLHALSAGDPRWGRRLALGALLAMATLAAGLALLGLSGWFITATAAAGLSLATARAFDVFTPSAGIRLLALGRTASRYGERLLTHDATLRALAALRARLFRGWSTAAAARRLQARPARLLFRLTADIDALDGLLLRLVLPAGLACAAALTAGVALASAAPLAGLALGAGLVLGAFAVAVVTARASVRIARRRVAALEALRMRTIDLSAGLVDLRLAGRLTAARAGWARAEDALARADDALHRLDTAAALAQALMIGVALAGTLAVVAERVAADGIGLPRAALALFVLVAAAEPLAALRRGAVEFGRLRIAALRVAPRLDADPGPCPAGLGQVPSPADPGVAARLAAVDVVRDRAGDTVPGAACTAEGDLDADAGAVPVLRDLSLTLRAGETVAVVGPSGAGKSTLLALLAGEVAPSAGRVEVSAATRFGQRTELFQDSLRDNLRLADPQAGDARLWSALEAAGLFVDVAAMPAGLDTRLGEGGLGLSTGQSRRLALARLLLTDAPLWLLDEPTEGLDEPTARDVLARLRERLVRQPAAARPDTTRPDAARPIAARTVVLVTHLQREAALADRLLVLEHGRLVADLARGDPGFDVRLGTLR